MTKKLFIIFPLILLLLAGCALNNDKEPSGTIKLTIENAKAGTRSILPEYPEIKGYKIIIEGSTKVEKEFKPEDQIIFENIPIGTCNVRVEAYSDDNYSNKVAEGAESLSVTPNSENSITVALDWLSDGNGSFSVTFDWSALTNTDNPIGEAIKRGSLGFMAWDKNNSKAFADASIQWADTTKTSFTYTQNNVPTTRNRRSENVSFRIYSKLDGNEQVIAETFYTSISILPNITSKEDGAESFAFNDNNITYYLKNVVNPKWEMSEEDSGSKIDVTWEYPLLSDGNYKVTVWVTNSSKNNELVGNKQTFTYSVTNGVASGDNSTTLSGLTPGNIYCLHFLNETNGSTLETYMKSADITPYTDIKTKVKVSSIAFEDNFKTTYVMGDTATIGAIILPDNATYRDYTVTATEGVTVNEKTVSFPSSGDYTITLTSEDADATIKTANKTVTVRLSKPNDFKLEKTEAGVQLSWSKVESATGYSIEKTYNGKTETLSVTDATYTDKEVSTGIDYTYRVKAVREDSKFDSDYTDTQAAKLSNVQIQITLPAKIESINNSKLVSDALSGKYVTDQKGFTIDIGNAISSEYTYAWYLNGVKVGEDNAKSVNIDKTTKGLLISNTESSNTLQLNVTKGAYTYSASATFHYIEEDPGDVTITGSSEIKGQNNTITLKATTSYDKAVIIWTSSDTSVATVSSTGVVTAVNDGKVTITATVAATGKSATHTVTSYISTLNFSGVPTNFMIVKKDGVNITNSDYSSLNLASYLEGAVGDRGNYTWTSSKTGVATVDSNGVVTPVGSGTTTITVVKDDAPSAYCNITVYDFDVTHNGTKVTGGEIATVGWSGKKTLALVEKNGLEYTSSINVTWCIGGDINCQEVGKLTSTLTITDKNSYKNAKLERGALAGTYTIYAMIQDKNGNIITKITFKSKSS